MEPPLWASVHYPHHSVLNRNQSARKISSVLPSQSLTGMKLAASPQTILPIYMLMISIREDSTLS